MTIPLALILSVVVNRYVKKRAKFRMPANKQNDLLITGTKCIL
jgi:hypothetical protein